MQRLRRWRNTDNQHCLYHFYVIIWGDNDQEPDLLLSYHFAHCIALLHCDLIQGLGDTLRPNCV